jgi:hypothetical protein
MKNRDFGQKSTLSKGKLQSEAFFDLFIAGRVHSVLTLNPNATAHILVGSTYGLDRHVNRLLELGFKIENIYIHEIVSEQAKRLENACKRRGYKCHVLTGDAVLNIRKLLIGGLKIAYIEFDGTKPYGSFGFDLFSLANQYGVECLLYEGDVRGQSQNAKRYAKSLGLKRTWHRNCRDSYLSYSLHDIAETVAKNLMAQYESLFTTYRGVSNMYAQVFVKA